MKEGPTEPKRRKKRGPPAPVATPHPAATVAPLALRVPRPEHREIARRAYELYQQRGGADGADWDDWFRAESQLLQEALQRGRPHES